MRVAVQSFHFHMPHQCETSLREGFAFQKRGPFQQRFLHEIPVERRGRGRRVSFTFRKHRPEEGAEPHGRLDANAALTDY